MKYSKAAPFLGLLMFCFMLAAQSAKADDIIFTDVGDTISVTGTGRFDHLSVSCTVEVLCSVTIGPPSGARFVGTTDLPHQFGLVSYIGITEPGTGTLSDALVITNLGTQANVTFLSDPPPTTGGGEQSLGTCGATFQVLTATVQIPCDIPEDGTQQRAGTINWTAAIFGGTVAPDHVIFQSTPEPE